MSFKARSETPEMPPLGEEESGEHTEGSGIRDLWCCRSPGTPSVSSLSPPVPTLGDTPWSTPPSRGSPGLRDL